MRPAHTPLVREHAEALSLAHRLIRSDAASAPGDRRALLRYWYGSGAAHLRVEEHVLLAAWARHGGEHHPLAAAIRAEHAQLSAGVAAIARDGHASPERLRATGHALAAHIHRQERELFGAVEHVVPPRELAEVGAVLESLRH